MQAMKWLRQKVFILAFTYFFAVFLEAKALSANLSSSSQNCLYGDWNEWTACWATCGADVLRSRYRTATFQHNVNDVIASLDCEDSVYEQENCSLPPCPNDCIVSDWSDWSPCNCQINQTERTRTILRRPLLGGRQCPVHLRDVKACIGGENCMKDCQLSEWSEWSACSATCGQGVSIRQRSVLTAAINGGSPCPVRGQLINCNAPSACPTGRGSNICEGLTGHLSDPSNDCSRYYISCSHGRTTWLLCPDILRFNKRSNSCDYPQNILPECAHEMQGSNGAVSVFDFRLFGPLAIFSTVVTIWTL